MSINASVFVADPTTKDITELAHDVATILDTTLIELDSSSRCAFAFDLDVDDILSLSCRICVCDSNISYLTTKEYRYRLSIYASGYKPNEAKEATIRCGQLVFERLKATKRYGLLLVLDFGLVIEEFDPNSD